MASSRQLGMPRNANKLKSVPFRYHRIYGCLQSIRIFEQSPIPIMLDAISPGAAPLLSGGSYQAIFMFKLSHK
jgi:hypothetical protein